MNKSHRLWHGPLLMGALSIIGITTALFSDSWGDVVSWITLSVPLGFVLVKLVR